MKIRSQWITIMILGAALFVILAVPNFITVGNAVSGVPQTTSTPSWKKVPTITPTSQPGIPQLIKPVKGAVLPQPVAPNEWLFRWTARMGPCYSYIFISGPGGRHIEAEVDYGNTGYEYRYVTADYIPPDALSPWTWYVKVFCPLGYSTSETRVFSVEPPPTPTPVPTATPVPTSQPTITPTSMPGPPILIAPANNAVLPQPVAPNEWLFEWDARRVCHCHIYINGPDDRHIEAQVSANDHGFEYHYVTDAYIPADALTPWTWYVTVHCPLGSNISETRTFSVEPPP